MAWVYLLLAGLFEHHDRYQRCLAAPPAYDNIDDPHNSARNSNHNGKLPEQLPGHVIVRGLAGPGREEHDRVGRLHAGQGEMARDPFPDLEPVPFPQHEEPGRQSGRVRRVSGFAH